MKAYVLIEITPGGTQDVMFSFGLLEGVTVVDRVTGPYDAIVIVSGSDRNAIDNFVKESIHTINGLRAVTCFVESS